MNYTLYRTCIAEEMTCEQWEKDLSAEGTKFTCSICKGMLCNSSMNISVRRITIALEVILNFIICSLFNKWI